MRGRDRYRRLLLRVRGVALPVAVAVAAARALGLAAPVPEAAVVVGEAVLVSGDRPDRPHVEPSLAVDPKDGQHLVAASMFFSADPPRRLCTGFVSFDGGRTWKRSPLPSSEGIESGSDPWVTFDPQGTAYLSCLGGTRTEKGNRTTTVAVYRSEDGGKSWTGPATVPGRAFDRPVIAAEGGGGSGPPTIYVAASQATPGESGGTVFPISVSRSIDGGRTFSPPVGILPNNVNNNLRSAAVLHDGTLLVVFYDIGSGGPSLFERFRIWAVRSADQGRTFSVPFFVNENPGGDVAQVAVDPKGPVYVAWDVTRGPESGIHLSRSEDGGRHWTAPARISDPVEGSGRQRVPSLAVDGRGTLGALWVDFRNDPQGRCSQPYFRASLDGGRTFLPSVRLTSEPSCPHGPGNVIRTADGRSEDLAERWPEGGDYHGLVAGGEGRFYALWADSVSGVYQLRAASVQVRSPAPTRGPALPEASRSW